VYTAKAGDRGNRPSWHWNLCNRTTYKRELAFVPSHTVLIQQLSTWTYASINGMRIPHGVGAVWAQAAWEVYWALVDHWGFDSNLYNATGNAGNQRMMLYVNEGLKTQPVIRLFPRFVMALLMRLKSFMGRVRMSVGSGLPLQPLAVGTDAV